MITFKENQIVTFETLECGVCGVHFALTAEMHRRMREDGYCYHCPNGHKITYTENESKILRQQLEVKERELRASKCETLNERIEKERAQRKLLRVKRGVCPRCNRTFSNLARHMATKHAKQ